MKLVSSLTQANYLRLHFYNKCKHKIHPKIHLSGWKAWRFMVIAQKLGVFLDCVCLRTASLHHCPADMTKQMSWNTARIKFSSICRKSIPLYYSICAKLISGSTETWNSGTGIEQMLWRWMLTIKCSFAGSVR